MGIWMHTDLAFEEIKSRAKELQPLVDQLCDKYRELFGIKGSAYGTIELITGKDISQITLT